MIARLSIPLACLLTASCATLGPPEAPATIITWDTESGETRDPPSRPHGRAFLPDRLSSMDRARSIDVDWDGVPLSSEEFVRTVRIAVEPQSPRLAVPGTQSFVVQPLADSTVRWKIFEVNSGTIVTEWTPIKGKTAGLWLWQKEYLTEVRHTISARPATLVRNALSYSIKTEVRERPNSEYPWRLADAELGRASQSQLRTVVGLALEAATKGRTRKK